MSILTLNDKSEHYLNEAESKKVQASLMKSGDGYLAVAGMTVKKSAIQSIKPGGEPAPVPFVDPWADEAHQLHAGKKCEGKNSIQHKINRIAQKLSGQVSEDNPDGDRWQGLIRDKDWREMIREKLRSSDKKWCDYRAGECACYD